MLVTSGLRSDELLQLRGSHTRPDEKGKYTAIFIGKGDTDAEQPLYPDAVKASVDYFKKAFGREPGKDEPIYWTLPRFPGDPPRPLPYCTLWRRVRAVGAEALKTGILKRDLEFSPHLFRRTYATTLDKAGMPITAIAELMRHANIQMTFKHYIDNRQEATPYLARILASA